MRSIHAIVPNDKRDLIKSVLDNLGIDYSFIGDSENTLFIITASMEESELVIESLEKVGLGKIYGSLMVYNIEYSTGRAPSKAVSRVSREEIEADITNSSVLNFNYVAYSIFASLLAGIALLTDNILILIASMIIAPAIGPILGLSLGIVIGNESLIKQAAKSEIAGLSISIIVGIFVGLIIPHPVLTDSVMARAAPTVIDIAFAILAGSAAALSIISVVSIALVGVAIAASIVPPAVNIGVGIAYALRGSAWGIKIALGSTLLLLVNIISIYLMSILLFWVTGIRPKVSERKQRIVRKELKRKVMVLAFAFLVISAPIIGESIEVYNEIKFEESIRREVISFIRENYPNVDVLKVSVNYFCENKSAEILLYLATATLPSSLPQSLKAYLEDRFDREIVLYVFYAVKA